MTKQIKLSTILATGKLWEKDEKSRTYLDAEEAAYDLGFFFERYRTGHIRRATFDGEFILKSEMQRVLESMDGVYYDNFAKEFVADSFFWGMLETYGIELIDDLNSESKSGGLEGLDLKFSKPKTRVIRLSDKHNEVLNALGSNAFLQDMLDGIIAGTVAIPVDTSRLTKNQQTLFIRGWVLAGGSNDVNRYEEPWCTPWRWSPVIVVHGTSIEDWGADWYRQCKPKIEAMRIADEGEDESEN